MAGKDKYKTVVKICKYCHKEFKVFPYRKDTAEYCSTLCQHNSLIGRISPKKGIKTNKIPWNKDIPHTEETKKKISNKVKGRKISQAQIDKTRESRKWYKHSDETKNKIRQSHFGIRPSEETKKKQSLMRIGKPTPPITEAGRERLRIFHTGLKPSLESREKNRQSHLGSKNVNWRWGEREYPDDWNEMLKESIRSRDEYICQECWIHTDELNNGQVKRLDVHHIDYNKDNLDPINLISLCRICHLKTNFNRDYWTDYFKHKISK